MIRDKKHDRKLGLLAADLVMARFKADEMKALHEVRDEAEAIIMSSGYLLGAPFAWVTLSLRFGLRNEDEPHYDRINKKYGDLPLAIEIDSHLLMNADINELKRQFMIATLKALIHAGRKYGLQTQELNERLHQIMT